MLDVRRYLSVVSTFQNKRAPTQRNGSCSCCFQDKWLKVMSMMAMIVAMVRWVITNFVGNMENSILIRIGKVNKVNRKVKAANVK